MLAMATVAKIRIAHLNDLYMLYRMMKISNAVSGTISIIRAAARNSLWYSPSQPM